MSLLPASQRAKAAIGPGNVRDYKLAPGTHAEELGGRNAEAGELARLLTNSRELQQIADNYDAGARVSDRMKRAHQWRATAGSIVKFVAVAVAAFFVAFPPRNWSLIDVTPYQEFWLFVGLLVSVAVATTLLWIFNPAGPRKKWMQSRTEQEALRRDYFRRVFAEPADVTDGDHIPILALQLEYFRRYLVDGQKKYYSETAQKHGNHAQFYRWLRAIGDVLILLIILVLWVVAIAPMAEQEPVGWGLPELSSMLHSWQEVSLGRMLLWFFIVIAAAAGVFMSIGQIDNSQVNAQLYHAAHANLVALAPDCEEDEAYAGSPLDRARNAAAEGDAEAVAIFVEEVLRLLQVENDSWRASIMVGRE